MKNEYRCEAATSAETLRWSHYVATVDVAEVAALVELSVRSSGKSLATDRNQNSARV